MFSSNDKMIFASDRSGRGLHVYRTTSNLERAPERSSLFLSLIQLLTTRRMQGVYASSRVWPCFALGRTTWQDNSYARLRAQYMPMQNRKMGLAITACVAAKVLHTKRTLAQEFLYADCISSLVKHCPDAEMLHYPIFWVGVLRWACLHGTHYCRVRSLRLVDLHAARNLMWRTLALERRGSNSRAISTFS
ncbi:hypothetical protein DFH11DRAFT_1583639 [Phellopilus nigrolimitatus]|nr:hypothetical protein DFH11DRAFT_1583639 [Phellopilus nigrolimitatus]